MKKGEKRVPGVKRLQQRQIDSAKPRAKQYSLHDGGGLHCLVLPAGQKYFQYRYSYPAGRKRLMQVGKFPLITLEQAREKVAQYKRWVDEGRDPLIQRRVEKGQIVRETAGTFSKT